MKKWIDKWGCFLLAGLSSIADGLATFNIFGSGPVLHPRILTKVEQRVKKRLGDWRALGSGWENIETDFKRVFSEELEKEIRRSGYEKW
jgi:hypothetical protein